MNESALVAVLICAAASFSVTNFIIVLILKDKLDELKSQLNRIERKSNVQR